MKISYRCEVCNDEKRYATFGEVAAHISTDHGEPLEDVTVVSLGLKYAGHNLATLTSRGESLPENLEEK